MFNRQLLNVIHLGLSFTVLFSADSTLSTLQKTISASISEDKLEYNVDGYWILGIAYSSFGVFLLLAPSFVAAAGPKISMCIGASIMTTYMILYKLEIAAVTYLGVVLSGLGGSLLWVGQGNYIVLNSDSDTVSRNIAVFWSMYASSFMFGNIFCAVYLEGKTRIDYETRQVILLVLASIAVASCILLALLMPPKRYTNNIPQKMNNSLETLIKTWHIFRTKEMLILIPAFIYTGFQLSFGSGVYPPSLGFTQHFGNKAKQLVPLAGLVFGLGDVIGGFLNVLLQRTKLKYSKRSVIFTGFLLQAIAYGIIYLNIPNEAILGETMQPALIQPTIWLALVCSFLIGIGDHTVNTQLYTLLAVLHPDHSAHTSALFKFSKSLAVALFFFCSSMSTLHKQLIFLFVVGIMGVAAFAWVDVDQSLSKKNNTCIDVTIK